jgi:hypothetical protein
MALGSILDGKQEKITLGERMNPDQPQFELYWRDIISREIDMYRLINSHLISEETYEVLGELKEYVRTVIC